MTETREVGEPALYSEQFLMTAMPALLEELWHRDSREPEQILGAFGAAGFAVDDAMREAIERKGRSIRFRLDAPADDAFARRLRAAVTKRLGKTTGPEKAWNIGCFRAGVTASGRSVDLRLFAEYSVSELRAAAADWLGGTDAAQWAVRHRYVDDRPVAERTADAARATFSLRSAEVHLHDDEGPHAAVLIPATVRAPGSALADSEPGFSALLAYLTETLGSATGSAEFRWERGARAFTMRRSSPTSRTPYLSVRLVTDSDDTGEAPTAAHANSPGTAESRGAEKERYAADRLLASIPAMIDDLWTRDSREPSVVLAALERAGLGIDDEEREMAEDGLLTFRFALGGPAEGVERALRAAVTKRVGKASGTDKHWHLGRLSATVSESRGTVRLRLAPEYSATELRDAAADWLQGADAAAWAVRHNYLDGRPALERTADQRAPFSPRATVHLHPPLGPRASFFLPPGVRAPGTKPADDDARFASVEDHLAEALGPPSTPGQWVRENRAFTFRRMRSRTRRVEFTTLRVPGP